MCRMLPFVLRASRLRPPSSYENLVHTSSRNSAKVADGETTIPGASSWKKRYNKAVFGCQRKTRGLKNKEPTLTRIRLSSNRTKAIAPYDQGPNQHCWVAWSNLWVVARCWLLLIMGEGASTTRLPRRVPRQQGYMEGI